MDNNMNASNSASQTKRILEYMSAGNKLTGLDALRMFGTMRLPARVADIEELGHRVSRRRVQVRNAEGKEVYVVEYSMDEQ